MTTWNTTVSDTNDQLTHLLPVMRNFGLYIAGSYASQYVIQVDWSPNDIDLWWSEVPEQHIIENLIDELVAIGYAPNRNLYKLMHYDPSWLPLNLINSDGSYLGDNDGRLTIGCPMDVVSQFSFTVCQAFIDCHGELHYTTACKESLRDKNLVLSSTTGAHNHLRSLVKYLQRGFTISDIELAKLEAAIEEYYNLDPIMIHIY